MKATQRRHDAILEATRELRKARRRSSPACRSTQAYVRGIERRVAAGRTGKKSATLGRNA
jgi:hypothetical protein